jgi:hypothetical protein
MHNNLPCRNIRHFILSVQNLLPVLFELPDLFRISDQMHRLHKRILSLFWVLQTL